MAASSRCVQPIKALLALRDLSNVEVARAVGCSAGYLGRVIGGREHPSQDLLDRMSDFLGEDAAALFVDRDADADRVVRAFVERTTRSSGVSERLTDDAAIAKTATVLGGGQDGPS